ncbi:SPOR domain-containing protein, partial [Agrobacterium sp. BETTINA12B]|nr:SPOR domain-containing protein [Agrobacterium sp. BETTINA12B]
QVASASPAATQAAPVASASAGGAYGVQIASLPSEAEAQRSQANLKTKFASVIGGHPLEIRKADIAGKGTYYRVRVVAGSKDDAADLCVRLRAAGGTCLISK